jgi:hypothetical protein
MIRMPRSGFSLLIAFLIAFLEIASKRCENHPLTVPTSARTHTTQLA